MDGYLQREASIEKSLLLLLLLLFDDIRELHSD